MSSSIARSGVTYQNHRFVLRREWLGAGGTVHFVMLNPSTATDTVDDATIRKCVGFGKRWGFSKLVVTNLFAYRTTYPTDLASLIGDGHIDLATGGELNCGFALEAVETSDMTVCAWGDCGEAFLKHTPIPSILCAFELFCIGTTKNGSPLHPSRAPYTEAPLRYALL